MWKLIFKYSDGGRVKITGKGKEATPAQLAAYKKTYAGAASATYQRYPLKDNEPEVIW